MTPRRRAALRATPRHSPVDAASETLLAVLDDRVAAKLTRRAPGEAPTLVYEDAWCADPAAYPLSLSLPLVQRTHRGSSVERVLQGLLPDNDDVRRALGQRHQVSPEDAFGLLAIIGEDCPGAVHFVRPDRWDAVRRGDADAVRWLRPSGLEKRLAALRIPGATGRVTGDPGQFSLPGRQPKTALLYDAIGGRWGVPAGRTPTSHILKPAQSQYPGIVENEHLCLELARALELPAAHSRVLTVGDERVLVVTRYDRLTTENGLLHRLHQEDLGQALGVHPQVKYEAQGAPGASAIVDFLRQRSANPGTDVATFLRALALNWILCGSDAHLRNYSVLIGAGGQVRLAPLYDVISIYPYRNAPSVGGEHRIMLAMGVGGERHGKSINATHWRALAEAVGVRWDDLRHDVRAMAEGTVDLLPGLVATIRDAGASDAAFLGTFVTDLTRRARRCARLLGAGTTPAYRWIQNP